METHHTMHIKSHSNVNPSSPCSSVSEPERLSGDNVVYKPAGEGVPDMIYLGSLSNFDLIYAWAQDKCVPLVREITFENGEVSSRDLHAKTPCRLFKELVVPSAERP